MTVVRVRRLLAVYRVSLETRRGDKTWNNVTTDLYKNRLLFPQSKAKK